VKREVSGILALAFILLLIFGNIPSSTTTSKRLISASVLENLNTSGENLSTVQVPVAARNLPWFFADFFKTLDRLENRASILQTAIGTENSENAIRRFSSSVVDYGLQVIMLDSIQKQLEGLSSDTWWKQEWSDNLEQLALEGKKLACYLYSIQRDPTPDNINLALERIPEIRTATLYVLFGAGLDYDGGGGDGGGVCHSSDVLKNPARPFRVKPGP